MGSEMCIRDSLDTGTVFIRNIVVHRAPKTYRRTYRAHGRINPYRSNPCHIEIHLSEPVAQVPKTATGVVQRLNKRELAKKRVAAARVAAAPAQA